MHPMNLLLIEDDEGIITPLTLYLTESGYSVSVCRDGDLAEWCVKESKPKLIILDINLPWKNGVEICRGLRTFTKTPIIVLSARESEEDKVTLLELGADDYVSKPFSPRELVARIAAVAKRSESQKSTKNGKMIEFGRLSLDPKNFIVRIDGKEIPFTKTEFSLLLCLTQNARSLVKRETIMRDIIGYENYIYDRTIDTHIKNIRKKTEWVIEIETVRGVWYRIREL